MLQEAAADLKGFIYYISHVVSTKDTSKKPVHRRDPFRVAH
jgi:hypothetical protein